MDEKKVREAIERIHKMRDAYNATLRSLPQKTRERSDYNNYVDAFLVAIEALEKQLPKKVENWNGQASCPGCKKLFGNMADIKMLRYWDFDYCNHCGQRLDWSEEES